MAAIDEMVLTPASAALTAITVILATNGEKRTIFSAINR
jgi:hypothetical protein